MPADEPDPGMQWRVQPSPPQQDRDGIAWSNPSLGQAGVVLLLVGWIVTAVVAVIGLFVVVMFLVMVRMMGRWFDQWSGAFDEFGFGMGPMRMFHGMEGFMAVIALLSVVAVAVATVLLYMAWNAARRGDVRRAGTLGIVGGVLATLFAELVGLVGLLGAIFVLVAAPKDRAGGAPPPPATLQQPHEPEAGSGERPPQGPS